MYSTCIFCRAPLGANDLIEHFPVGRRLAPLEERWEPVEECERAFRGTRLRVSTDHIGLATHPSGLELVRIGPALRPEFAAWRYAPRFRRRRRNTLIAGGAGAVAFGRSSRAAARCSGCPIRA